MSAPEPRSVPTPRWGDLAPTLLLALLCLGIVLVRPPLPIDETRYLEVLREHLSGSVLLLHLQGEPYAEKPPLLFWLARALTALGVPADTALRVLPGLAAALTVLFVARIGRRAGLALAGWWQASLLLPFFAASFVLFDPLLACCVWGALDGWTSGKPLGWLLGCTAALLTKGPVAFLFLIPFLWSLEPISLAGRAGRTRALALLGLALLPLAAWALGAATMGGPEFARALLWERWAGRVVNTFAHDRPFYIYLPITLVGALPGTFFLLRWKGVVLEAWARRLVGVVLFLLAVFTLISGKQAHYLTPLVPALALLLAWRSEHARNELRWLTIGARAELVLFLVLVGVVWLKLDALRSSTGTVGLAFLDRGAAMPALVCALGMLLLALAATVRWRGSIVVLLASALLGMGTTALVVHGIAGKLLFPHALSRVLGAAPEVPVACLGSTEHGLYQWLAGREIERLDDIDAVQRWGRGHPGGLILAEEALLPEPMPAGLVSVASDVVHRKPVRLLRAE